jgi:uncharacterized protein YkwD
MQANSIVSNVTARREVHPDRASRRPLRRSLTTAIAGALIAASMLANSASSLAAPAISIGPVVTAQTAQAPSQYFAETGKTVKGDFLRAFRKYGLEALGYPISSEVTEGGITVQYFERARMEYHPKLAAKGRPVLLTRLGASISGGSGFSKGMPFTPDKTRTYFSETGHSLTGAFLTYWRQKGGLELFGYPISEVITQDGMQVQWFERARFEYHPELASNGTAVQLTRLGSLAYDRLHQGTSQVLPSSAPAPAAAQAKAQAPAPSHQMNGAETAIVDEINRLRRQAGLAPVQPAGDLADLARARSTDMATRNYFSHTTPEGSGFLSMLKDRGIGYKFAGEILAKNSYPDDTAPGTAIVTWLNSPAHKAIMYDGRFTHAGSGYAKAADGMHYFTVIFVQK